ncbi:MAG: acyl carrier protein [Nocardiaceae bacterium]|nr:acyl carrier protein [Nocardiaceae bacterium]
MNSQYCQVNESKTFEAAGFCSSGVGGHMSSLCDADKTEAELRWLIRIACELNRTAESDRIGPNTTLDNLGLNALTRSVLSGAIERRHGIVLGADEVTGSTTVGALASRLAG